MAQIKLTPFAKLLITVAILSVAGAAAWHLGLKKALEHDVAPPNVPVVPSIGGPVAAVPTVAAPAGCESSPDVRFQLWAWNAQMGGMFANGGPRAAAGSLMCANHVDLQFTREDDVSRMQESLVAFATSLKNGNAQPTEGAHFVAIMGDGAAGFLRGVNETLGRLGPDYTARVVGSMGYSRGEDKFMGPAAWRTNPQAARGGVVSGYLRDGDWNIAMKWLADNGICNNPDEHTYDANCLNWVAADDYIDAGAKYIADYCEDRPVVSGGRRTGENHRTCVQGVVTWTPGDVNIATQKGGLVSIVSTREYSAQMPNTIIGIHKWTVDNRATVEGMLGAFFAGADQVTRDPQALATASGISAIVYHEQDAAYWQRYFAGVTERDRTGVMVELGGSKVNNLADNAVLFGLTPGGQNLFAATYRVFGDVLVQQYPDLVPNYPAVDQILDTSFVRNLLTRAGADHAPAEAHTFDRAQPVTTVVSRRAWSINFQSGSAVFAPNAMEQLEQLQRELLVAGSQAVEVHGHTDNQGNRDANMRLSEERAFALKQWLEQRAPANFPNGRIRVFAHGQENPIQPNTTNEGRAQNRRVEIVLGTT